MACSAPTESGTTLGARMAAWMDDPAALAAAAAAMAAAGRPDAAERLADEVDALAATRGAGQEKAA